METTGVQSPNRWPGYHTGICARRQRGYGKASQTLDGTVGVNPKVLEWARGKFKDERRAANFARWFGDSEMVDENGHPKVFYHGSPEVFSKFNTNLKLDESRDRAAFFSDNPEVSSGYAHHETLESKKLAAEKGRLTKRSNTSRTVLGWRTLVTACC